MGEPGSRFSYVYKEHDIRCWLDAFSSSRACAPKANADVPEKGCKRSKVRPESTFTSIVSVCVQRKKM